MSARVYRPEFDQSRFDSAQIGSDYYREVAERFLIPQIKERQRQALNVVPDFFQFYQRAYTGRRCSCWMGTETSPAANCLVCYSTGNTASYQLYGYVTEVFDATAEAATVGVIRDFEQITRPIQFRLVKSALRGHIDFMLNVRGGINMCTLASLHAVAPRGTRIRAACKLFSEPGFTALSIPAITERLQQAQLQGGLHLRIYMERDSISTQSPRFSHLRLRYRTLDDDRIRGDVPRSDEGNRTSEFGWFSDVALRTLYIDSTLRSITTEDIFRQVNSGKLWRVSRVNANAPGSMLLSWDLETKLIQPHEKLASLP